MRILIAVLGLSFGVSSFGSELICNTKYKEDVEDFGVVLTARSFNEENLINIDLFLTETKSDYSFDWAKYDPTYAPQPQNKDKRRFNILKNHEEPSEFDLLVPKEIKSKRFDATLVLNRWGYHGDTEYRKLTCATRESETVCQNYAKNGAIRAYRANFGGSNDISATATIEGNFRNNYDYSVIVETTGNEGADDYNIVTTYDVTVQEDNRTRKCSVVSAVPRSED